MDALRSLLTAVESPEDRLNSRFLAARELVRAAPAGSLSDLSRIPALLALGDHGAALDRLRAMRPLHGPRSQLLDYYASWTGDRRWLAQLGADGLRNISGTAPPPGQDAESAFARWRSDPAGLSPEGAAELVIGAIVSIWGLVPDAAAQSLAIEPTFPDEWRSMALRNLRIGETLLDLILRRTRNGVELKVSRTRGPAIRLALTMAGADQFDVDGERLSGGRAVFRVEGEHAVMVRR